MLVFMVRRSLRALLVLLVMAMLIVIGVYAIGNPVDRLINPPVDQQQRAHAIAALGLDEPPGSQSGGFLSGALRGELGVSSALNTRALGLALDRLPATLELAIAATLLGMVLGVPLGLWAGWKPDSGAGRTIIAGATFGYALPTFWLGMMLILVFAVLPGWLPASGRGPTTPWLGLPVSFLSVEGWRHLILPATSLALFQLALFIRVTRAGTREALRQGYVQFAQAKGLTNTRVIGVHLLRNVVVPIVTASGPAFASVIALALVIEPLFIWPGVGKLLIDSLGILDRPAIMASLLVTLALLVAITLLLDLLHAWLDPRVRLKEAKE